MYVRREIEFDMKPFLLILLLVFSVEVKAVPPHGWIWCVYASEFKGMEMLRLSVQECATDKGRALTQQEADRAEAWKEYKDGYYDKAIRIWMPFANKGDRNVQFLVAAAYDELWMHRSAFHWYYKLAKQGDKEAQFQLAWKYQHGLGVQSEMTKAIDWYRKAAEQGDADAQHNLAVLYRKSLPIHNTDLAKKWYEKALKQGKAASAWNLSLMYAAGDDVKKRGSMAEAYRIVAKKLGSLTAIKYFQDRPVFLKGFLYAVEGSRLAAEIEKSIHVEEQEISQAVGAGFALPANGSIRMFEHLSRNASLKINTRGDRHHFIKFLRQRGKQQPPEYQLASTIFIRAGMSIELDFPSGEYEMRWAIGKDWSGYEKLFGQESTYGKADTQIVFKPEYVKKITLYDVADGNLSSTKISSDQFTDGD